MSTTATSTYPTLSRYQCGSGCGVLTFQWGRQMPENGRLGTVTFREHVNKPIQVFDRQDVRYNGQLVGYNWGFQAQDGLFLGRMFVSLYQSFIGFTQFRPGDPWPRVTCTATATPDPRDTREAIDKMP